MLTKKNNYKEREKNEIKKGEKSENKFQSTVISKTN